MLQGKRGGGTNGSTGGGQGGEDQEYEGERPTCFVLASAHHIEKEYAFNGCFCSVCV